MLETCWNVPLSSLENKTPLLPPLRCACYVGSGLKITKHQLPSRKGSSSALLRAESYSAAPCLLVKEIRPNTLGHIPRLATSHLASSGADYRSPEHKVMGLPTLGGPHSCREKLRCTGYQSAVLQLHEPGRMQRIVGKCTGKTREKLGGTLIAGPSDQQILTTLPSRPRPSLLPSSCSGNWTLLDPSARPGAPNSTNPDKAGASFPQPLSL